METCLLLIYIFKKIERRIVLIDKLYIQWFVQCITYRYVRLLWLGIWSHHTLLQYLWKTRYWMKHLFPYEDHRCQIPHSQERLQILSCPPLNLQQIKHTLILTLAWKWYLKSKASWHNLGLILSGIAKDTMIHRNVVCCCWEPYDWPVVYLINGITNYSNVLYWVKLAH